MSRTVIITGATSGFGVAMVREFLAKGDTVIATGRNLNTRSDIFSSEKSKFKHQLIEVNLDVTSEAECLSFKKFIDEKNYKIDILINNAGYGLFGALADLSLEQIRHQFEVNFFGTVRITQSLLPMIIKSKGKIFNFSSVFGFSGFPLSSAYCASKFAVEGFSESLDYELRPHGVQVCLIEPGGYRTKFGTSSMWGQHSDKAFEVQTKNYHALRQKMMTRKNYQDPADLAAGVWSLSNRSSLPLRVPFGKDAKATAFIRKIMPAFALHRMSHKMFNKIFMKSSHANS